MSQDAIAPVADEAADMSHLIARAEKALGLRQLADFIGRDDVPTPHRGVSIGIHISDREEYDEIVARLGLTAEDDLGAYEAAKISFAGDTEYYVQTHSPSRARLAERERRIAQRERELGLTADEIAA